jgi:hypothetical protein
MKPVRSLHFQWFPRDLFLLHLFTTSWTLPPFRSLLMENGEPFPFLLPGSVNLFADEFRTACDTKNRVEQCRLLQSIPVRQWVFERGFAWANIEQILITVHPLQPLRVGVDAYDWVIVAVKWQDGSVQHVGIFASNELTLPGMSGSANMTNR